MTEWNTQGYTYYIDNKLAVWKIHIDKKLTINNQWIKDENLRVFYAHGQTLRYTMYNL